MRVHDEHTPHASWSFGVRQFSARATSSANSFLPIPSSPVNSSAPGRRPDTSMRFNAALTRAFPVSSSNILHCQVPATLQERNDYVFHAFLRAFHWSTRIDQLHARRFGECNLQVCVTHARVKVSVFDVQPIARAAARRSSTRPPRGAIDRLIDPQIKK